MRNCEYCGKEFAPASPNDRHCSDSCWYDDFDDSDDFNDFEDWEGYDDGEDWQI